MLEIVDKIPVILNALPYILQGGLGMPYLKIYALNFEECVENCVGVQYFLFVVSDNMIRICKIH